MKRVVSLALTLHFLTWASLAHARVVISEVYANPTDASEWVELYNDGQTAVALTNWQLKDLLSAPSTLLLFPNFELQANEIKVVEVSGQKLNNTGDTVQLIDDSSSLIDSFSFSTTTKGLSWHKNLSTGQVAESEPSPGSLQQLLFSPEPSPLPQPTTSPIFASPPSTPTPSPSSAPSNILDYLTIPEIYACPYSGESEWIKLTNGANQEISLTDVVFVDLANNTISLPQSLYAAETRKILLPKALLNNAGETLFMSTLTGSQTKVFEFPECQIGLSSSQYPAGSPSIQPSGTTETSATTNTTINSTISVSHLSAETLQRFATLSDTLYAFPILVPPQKKGNSPNNQITIAVPTRKELPKSGVIYAIVGGLFCCSASLWYYWKQKHNYLS